jgi:spore coat protein U-like protein
MKNSVKSSINQRLFKIVALSAVLLDAAGLSLPVYANSSTSDINVSANTSGYCIISNTDLNFGAYEVIAANATQDLTAFATISTTCTSGASAYVIMDNGLHSIREQRISGRMIFYTDHRHMSNAGSDSKLQYELYTNDNHTTVWHSSYRQFIVGSGVSENLTVFGKVFKNQQDAVAGSYTDTINIKVIY